jgi:hypothetical protein
MSTCVEEAANETAVGVEITPTNKGAHFKATDATDTVEAFLRVQDSSARTVTTISDEQVSATRGPLVSSLAAPPGLLIVTKFSGSARKGQAFGRLQRKWGLATELCESGLLK